MLREATIQELRQILKEDYGLNISFEEASEIAHALTSYYEIVLDVFSREARMGRKPGEVAYSGNRCLPDRL